MMLGVGREGGEFSGKTFVIKVIGYPKLDKKKAINKLLKENK